MLVMVSVPGCFWQGGGQRAKAGGQLKDIIEAACLQMQLPCCRHGSQWHFQSRMAAVAAKAQLRGCWLHMHGKYMPHLTRHSDSSRQLALVAVEALVGFCSRLVAKCPRQAPVM